MAGWKSGGFPSPVGAGGQVAKTAVPMAKNAASNPTARSGR
ncbi:hypothetical protein O1M54_17090 [Streptomyces diastatochromogenes]|nr:hypothetical protein [Streptomyces diastatochromogenes]